MLNTSSFLHLNLMLSHLTCTIPACCGLDCCTCMFANCVPCNIVEVLLFVLALVSVKIMTKPFILDFVLQCLEYLDKPIKEAATLQIRDRQQFLFILIWKVTVSLETC